MSGQASQAALRPPLGDAGEPGVAAAAGEGARSETAACGKAVVSGALRRHGATEDRVSQFYQRWQQDHLCEGRSEASTLSLLSPSLSSPSLSSPSLSLFSGSSGPNPSDPCPPSLQHVVLDTAEFLG